jgi:RimJ/RimL family protein N-acetyltransferase
MIAAPQNGVTDFIIIHKVATHPIGKIGVWQDQEIGFLLSRSYWGQGIAQEALHGVLSYLFGEKGMEEVTADVDPRNYRSIKLLEGVAFVRTGFKERTWEIGSEWVDSLYFGLRRENWVDRENCQR